MIESFGYILLHWYGNVILIYSILLFLSYILLAIFSRISINRNLLLNKTIDQSTFIKSRLCPGISIVAPAFNESVTIIHNIRSLLTLNYPKFEVIIVNDGSTDDTLEKIIQEFKMVKVDYVYDIQLETQAIRGHYKSTEKAYKKLLVIDKVNGKSKADALNAGINAAVFPYLLNTDVDCILHRDTLIKLVEPFLIEHRRVIGVGATLRIANSCEFDQGMMVRMRPPKSLLPRFQEVEYIRSYLMGKMGWSHFNAVPNISGALGLFDMDIVIKSGGYDPKSFGEDMDILVRMVKYMHETNQDYVVRYIPQTLCWTEAPDSLKVLTRQRVRWARGLFQIFAMHRKVLFNPKYGRLGLVTLPYNFLFEFLAPFIVLIGMVIYGYMFFAGQLTWVALALLLYIYTLGILVSSVAILWDQITFRYYKSWKEVLGLCLMAFIEPIIYHPIGVFSSLKGYYLQATGRSASWGNMQRKGIGQQTSK